VYVTHYDVIKNNLLSIEDDTTTTADGHDSYELVKKAGKYK